MVEASILACAKRANALAGAPHAQSHPRSLSPQPGQYARPKSESEAESTPAQIDPIPRLEQDHGDPMRRKGCPYKE
jgi:hypothetical protein